METLSENEEKKPRSGLYTLQFSYVPGESVLEGLSTAKRVATQAKESTKKGKTDASGLKEEDDISTPVGAAIPPLEGTNANTRKTSSDKDDSATGTKPTAAAIQAASSDLEAKHNAIKKACATEYCPWTLLCRLRFEGEVMGRIKGSVKVKPSAPSSSCMSSSNPPVTSSMSPITASAAEDGDVPIVTTTPTKPPITDQEMTSSSDSITPHHTSDPSRAIGSPSHNTVGSFPSPSDRGSLVCSNASGGTRCCIQSESMWKPSDEVRLVISADRLDGSVIGHDTDLCNVTIRCYGHVSDGWYVGSATITLPNNTQLSLSRKLRFLLKEYKGLRCSWCLDPVDEKLHCCPECLTSVYCSDQCKVRHQHGHQKICAALKPYGSYGGRAPATFAGSDFYVYWRCVKGCQFELLVDFNNPIGRAYEIQLNPLKDAREGLEYAFLMPPGTPPVSEGDTAVSPITAQSTAAEVPPTAQSSSSSSFEGPSVSKLTPMEEVPVTDIHELNVAVFFAVAQSSLDEGALLLSSACLNHLFAWCENVDNLIRPYYQFYDTAVRDQYEGVRQICCLGEYVLFVRTTYELGHALLEWALKAPLANLFWQRMVAAKDVLVSLYNFNSSLQFAPGIQNVKPTLVCDQQRQTLHLLARVFTIMASRAEKDLAQRLLHRAEECYKDSLDEDRTQKNFREMGNTCFKLSAIATMFETPEDKSKVLAYKKEGVKFITNANSQQIASSATSPVGSIPTTMQRTAEGIRTDKKIDIAAA